MTKLSGFGVGLRPPHYQHMMTEKPKSIDWFEIISENFMATGGRPRHVLQTIRDHYPVVMHGVGLSIAGTDDLDQNYLQALKKLAEWLKPEMITDHLCWTSSRGRHSHDLLPFPYNGESLKHLRARIDTVQEFLGRTIVLENPSAYVAFKGSDMGEAEFLESLCRQTGCGILLDLNNLYVNSQNLGMDPLHYLNTLSAGHVRQFHLAGHTVYPDIRIDTHDHHVPEEVWHLYRLATLRFPETPTLLEWDDKIPEVAVLLEEVARARREATAAQNKQFSAGIDLSFPRAKNLSSSDENAAPVMNLASLQTTMFDAISQKQEPSAEIVGALLSEGAPVKADRGFSVYHQGFFLRARESLKEFFPTLAFVVEDAGMDSLVAAYIEQFPSSHYSINYIGRHFENFLRNHPLPMDFGVDQNVLADLAALEWAHIELYLATDGPSPVGVGCLTEIGSDQWARLRLAHAPTSMVLDLDYNIAQVWKDVAEGKVPEKPQEETQTLLVYRNGFEVIHEVIPEREGMAYRLFQEGRPLWDVCQALAGRAEPSSLLLQEVMGFIQHWFTVGIVTEIMLDA